MEDMEKIYKEFYANNEASKEKHTKKYLAEKEYEVEIIWHDTETGKEENEYMLVYAKDFNNLKLKLFELFNLKYRMSKVLGRINSINEFQ